MAQAHRRGFTTYRLKDVQPYPSTKSPAVHQEQALTALRSWFRNAEMPKGGILVLPTGGGKTFTATRYLTSGPLSQGHKVLWLAHTHHLLDQAFLGFGRGADGRYEVGHVNGSQEKLTFRTVSGTVGHGKVTEIKGTDDVVIITLQTLARAMRAQVHTDLKDFLRSARASGLTVVFDECHHAPAPSFRRLIEALRDAVPELHLLGLTATPTYTDERRQGHLGKLFPQGMLYQVSPQELMVAGVLARPRVEEPATHIQPDFPEQEYREWLGSYRDIPEKVIEHLARNRERNARIADTYVQNRQKYGQTIMFADRWYQCTALVELLRERGVKADAIFTHKDADLGSAEARNSRKTDENEAVLERFRRKELDVLVNIRMLTEGTDVPNVQSVFLTRQTTSRILLTQMIGRALRGPRFGGTSDAYIVAFIDEWKQHVNWARWDDLVTGGVETDAPSISSRLPVEFVSLELIEHLSREIDPGEGTALPFLTLLPVGWYVVDYDAAVKPRASARKVTGAPGEQAAEDTQAEEENERAADNVETVRQLIAVYDRDEPGYARMFHELDTVALDEFEDVELRESTRQNISSWVAEFFPAGDHLTRLEQDVLSVIRHRARNGSWPVFTPFEAREQHDIDALAQDIAFERQLSRFQEDQALRQEFEHSERLWTALYRNYDQFKRQYDQSVNRIMYLLHQAPAAEDLGVVDEVFEVDEVSGELKKKIRQRDERCLCCGDRTSLQVDHIRPRYLGGLNTEDNLQTLCRRCNTLKGTREINFMLESTPLKAPMVFPDGEIWGLEVLDEELEFRLRRIVNMTYGCSAISGISTRLDRMKRMVWSISLNKGNDVEWVRPLLKDMYEARLRIDRSFRWSAVIEVQAGHKAG